MNKEIKITYYDDGGQLSSETPLLNGNYHGLQKWYYKDGQLNWEIPYINGRLRGLEKGWYENGQIWNETTLKNSLQCGVKIIFKY
jgi:antitoxin component YwqK of YwqJK toxin-antitoxin module